MGQQALLGSNWMQLLEVGWEHRPASAGDELCLSMIGTVWKTKYYKCVPAKSMGSSYRGGSGLGGLMYFVLFNAPQGQGWHHTLVTCYCHLAPPWVRSLAVTCIGVVIIPIIHEHFVKVNDANVTGERLLREPS